MHLDGIAHTKGGRIQNDIYMWIFYEFGQYHNMQIEIL